jgi:GntR family transcriptional repressor for pyruvate dehydrogenase complex
MAHTDIVAFSAASDELGTPSRPATLGDRVYHQLASQIAGDQYGPSGKLPSEHELARTFDVSRPVVRDALRRLRAEGIIYSRQGAGSFVVGTPAEKTSLAFRPAETIADVQRCYEFRETIETIAAALAAQRRNRTILDQLDAIVRRFRRATASNIHSEDLDFEFHLTIARASNNQYFPTVMMALREQIAAGMRLHGNALMSPTGRLEQSTEEHVMILDAIRRQDPGGATERMRLHIRNSRDRLFGGGLLDLSM